MRLLKIFFFLPLIVSFSIVFLYESEILIPHGMFLDDGVSYIVLMLIELITLAVVPLALYLFKMKNVKKHLKKYKEKALLKFGCLRLSILGVVLIANTALYYLSGLNTSGAVKHLVIFSFDFYEANNCVLAGVTSSKLRVLFRTSLYIIRYVHK